MNSAFANWIKGYADWAAALLFAAAVFTALTAANFAIPLVLFAIALTIAAFHHWQAIRDFDLWAFDEWFRTRLDAIGTRDWQAPYHAAESYCSTAVVMARNEAAATMNSIMMELVKDEGPSHAGSSSSARPHVDYDAAQIRFSQCNAMLARELLTYLVQGQLIAKGLLVHGDVTKSERIIPTSRWRIMTLDIAKAEASGHGWNYSGIVIGRRPPKAQPQKPAQPQQPARQQPPQQAARPQPQQAARPQAQQPARPQPQPPIRPPQKYK